MQKPLFCEACGQRPVSFQTLDGKFLCHECASGTKPEDVAQWEASLLAMGWELDQREFPEPFGTCYKWFPKGTPEADRYGYYEDRADATRQAFLSYSFQIQLANEPS